MNRRQLLTVAALTAATAVGGLAAFQQPAAYTVPTRMAWWYAARFGMFIHFGSCSYLGRGEWVFNDENRSKADYQQQVFAGRGSGSGFTTRSWTGTTPRRRSGDRTSSSRPCHRRKRPAGPVHGRAHRRGSPGQPARLLGERPADLDCEPVSVRWCTIWKSSLPPAIRVMFMAASLRPAADRRLTGR
ncbi:alpha-L-fucosidase [Nonomuraea sp. NPDC048916]|uniref:alpha-L-fucosidase n=1 Tax=Nonomuraea sp. NPDC048916 TaxID=3154232 RepID=UPI0033F87483